MDKIVIAIGGVSRAGKTTLSTKLKNDFSNKKAVVLCQDDYIRDVENIPKIKDRIDWEHPDSIDHVAFFNAILEAQKNADIVIVEGLMVYYDLGTSLLFDKKIFIQIDHETFVRRKEKDFRWGIEPDWYIQHIWDSFFKYGSVELNDSFLVLQGNKEYSDTLIHKFLGI